MLTIALALLLATATACLPVLLHFTHRFHGKIPNGGKSWLLTSIAALCMGISVFLPDIHISVHTHTFQQHFVGGGIYTLCLFIYVKQLLGWRLHWFAEILVLFAWTSAFGVALELLEFLATQIGVVHLANADTDWDLLANTLGAFILYLTGKTTRTLRHFRLGMDLPSSEP